MNTVFNTYIPPISAIFALVVSLAACGPNEVETKSVAAKEPVREVVNGWIEYPLARDVIKLHSAPWRTDVIEIPVPPNGGDLEYKLAMKSGDAFVYSIDFGRLDHAGVFVSEFHGHTPKRADGVGDLMFYSRTGGAPQSGQFTAPWDGIHGWYLKNDSAKHAVVTLELAGYYELIKK